MNFLELVQHRQSVRKYLPDPVSRETIEHCISAARLAPSACNSQPWHFVIIDDPELKRHRRQHARQDRKYKPFHESGTGHRRNHLRTPANDRQNRQFRHEKAVYLLRYRHRSRAFLPGSSRKGPRDMHARMVQRKAHRQAAQGPR